MFRVILINVLFLVAILAAAEGALYYLLSRGEPTSIGAANRVANRLYWRSVNLIQFQPDCAQYDPELLYTLRPGDCVFESPVFSTEVAINSAGLRDDEASLSAPSVVVTGDSHAMGWGVEQDETFAELIETETGLTTLNAAISSYGTAREVGILDRLDLSEIEVLVVQYSDNDDDENRAYLDNGRALDPRPEEDYAAEAAKTPRENYYPFRYLGLFFQMLSERSSAGNGDAAAAPLAPGTDVNRFLDILADAEFGDRKPLLVVMELSLYGKYRGFADNVAGADAAIRAALDEAYSGIVVIDTQELLSGEDYLHLDGHTTASGHAKIAAAVVAELQAAGIGAQ